jgi:hypothetical protein
MAGRAKTLEELRSREVSETEGLSGGGGRDERAQREHRPNDSATQGDAGAAA